MALRFAALVLLIGGIGAALIAAWGFRLGESALRGALLGAVLASAGAIGGMMLLARSMSRGPGKFVGAVLLGFLARLVGFGAVLILVGLRARAFDLVATAASLMAFYAAFQILEVWFVLKQSREGRT